MEKQADPPITNQTEARRRKHSLLYALICGVVAAAVCALVVSDNLLLERRELAMWDSLTNDRGGVSASNDLVLVGIDDASLNILDVLDEERVLEVPELDAMSFGYPFPRAVYASMTEKLLDAGAKLIVFDMLFTGEAEGDAELKAVFDANPGKIVVGANLVVREIKGAVIPEIDLPSPTVIDELELSDPRVGFVNPFPETDGTVRSVIPAMRTFAHEEAPVRYSLVMAALKQLGEESRISDPFSEQHLRFPEFLGDERPYEPIPFYSIFLEDDWERNLGGGERFRDKIVFVGGSSIVRFHDVLMVPEGEILGAQYHMATLAAGLDGAFYHVPSKTWRVATVVGMAALVFGMAFLMRRLILGLLLLIGVGAGYAGLVAVGYSMGDTLLPAAAPLFTLAVAGLGCFGTNFAVSQVEKARLRRTLERQMSKELADHVMSVPEDYFQSLPGVRKPVTVLFSDIRSFTSRSEKDDPAELVAQLKEYLDAMGEIVFEHGGMVDKFIGDAVMAVWGNLHTGGAQADSRNAVAAAIAMQQKLAELNEKWAAAGREGFEVGIGLNHGEAIFGMMGSEQKQEMTVIGDPVNQAARLEGLTKKFGQEIIIGPQVAEFARGEFLLRSLGLVQTMGKLESQELSAVLAGDNEDDWTSRFHAALKAFQAGRLEEANTLFKACGDERPDDRAVTMYLEAVRAGESSGVLVMSGK